MRLIDADAVIERIEKVIQKAIERGEITDYMEEESAYVIAWLYTEPTAYDIDEVINDLENASYCKSTPTFDHPYTDSVIDLDEAIDIVKRGKEGK